MAWFAICDPRRAACCLALQAAMRDVTSSAQLALLLRSFEEGVHWEAVRKPPGASYDPKWYNSVVLQRRPAENGDPSHEYRVAASNSQQDRAGRRGACVCVGGGGWGCSAQHWLSGGCRRESADVPLLLDA